VKIVKEFMCQLSEWVKELKLFCWKKKSW